MPEQEAKRYGDRAFTQMMYAKIVTVQLINRMGYDVLFQVSRTMPIHELNIVYFSVHAQSLALLLSGCRPSVV